MEKRKEKTFKKCPKYSVLRACYQKPVSPESHIKTKKKKIENTISMTLFNRRLSTFDENN